MSTNKDFILYNGLIYEDSTFTKLIGVFDKNIKKAMLHPNTEFIGYSALSNLENLKSVIANCENLDSIDECAFKNCKNLEYVELKSERNITISSNAFTGCNIKSFKSSSISNTPLEDFLDSIEEIELAVGNGPYNGRLLFDFSKDNLKIKNIIIHTTKNTFTNFIATDQKSNKLLLYPQGKTEKTVIVPDNFEELDEFALASNPYIEEIHIGSNAKRINEEAFANLKNLKAVYIKSDDIEIGINAFCNCPLLEEVYLTKKAYEKCIEKDNPIFKCTDLDYLISKKSFKEINKIYKESELEK